MRFPVEWAAIEPQKGEYDDAYLDAVTQRIQWLTDAGLMVVLDMHQDPYGEGFGHNGAPVWTCSQAHYDAVVSTTRWFANYANEHVIACYDQSRASDELQNHYAEAWRRLAARLSAFSSVVGFDVLNEPYWGSLGPASFDEGPLTVLYKRVVEAVREEAPDWVAFLEPSASRSLGFTTHLEAFPLRDVMYAPHSYDSEAEGGGGLPPKGARRCLVTLTYSSVRRDGWTRACG